MRRREMLKLSVAILAAGLSYDSASVRADDALVLHKDPACGCCTGHADYLRAHGFAVTVVETPDLDSLRRQHGVPEALAGCHTILADGYVIEGHVPVEPIRRLLSERPDIVGIALAGMPMGSPGMGGEKTAPFVIYRIEREAGADAPKVFAIE
ncbi:hypothetical protein FRZ44_41820 [Hypericibacter terrae]|uniref:Metal-binding protein n=2 Tax=Hypericibacter terrae TaxID=2602015 RepID=A0A5J6MNR1_9PROT|nr:hypothetical protein FRZ44_41820 [Hypericibacter terrae]